MASKSSAASPNSSLYKPKPEHRIFWTSRESETQQAIPCSLYSFFTQYASQNQRAFPWRRKNVSPFHLLLAEVLLVQTKAEDVARIWPVLTARYKNPAALAKARESSLVKLLRPLGLHNQRARSLKAIGKALSTRFKGKMPRIVDDLLSVPHIGLYTAAAVACFKFGACVPIVDANVLRVFARITGQDTRKDLRRSKEAWALAWALLPPSPQDCQLHNYGILDFAAQVCSVRNPKCNTCPLNEFCHFGQQRVHLSTSEG